MNFTCIDCVSWNQFIVVVAVAITLIVASVVSFRSLKHRNPAGARIAFFAFGIPAALFLVHIFSCSDPTGTARSCGVNAPSKSALKRTSARALLGYLAQLSRAEAA